LATELITPGPFWFSALKFDIVTLNAVDTAGAQASLLSVNFLYTTEAFDRYLARLRVAGI